jgi:hypothetical protein
MKIKVESCGVTEAILHEISDETFKNKQFSTFSRPQSPHSLFDFEIWYNSAIFVFGFNN